jgi:hypothetical protein
VSICDYSGGGLKSTWISSYWKRKKLRNLENEKRLIEKANRKRWWGWWESNPHFLAETGF